MKIAFILFEGMSALDFVGIYDPLARLKTLGFLPDLDWELVAYTQNPADPSGLRFSPDRVGEPLAGYTLVVLPGGARARNLVHDPGFVSWLKTAADSRWKASVGTGALLLGAAGFLEGKRATTHPDAMDELRAYASPVDHQRIVDEGDVITAGGGNASIDLGLYLVEKLAGSEAGEEIRRQMDYVGGAQSAPVPRLPRTARVSRQTKETQISLELGLDGTGRHSIETGIGFLDHMLAHLAVHGLFDLRLQAAGDLQIDVHHTVEDVALVLGQAFSEALGDRAGIVRMASAYAPMDETLAFVAVDFSGRPYASVEAGWHTPSVGGIPASLFPHFLESFSVAARCNLHARILSGRDDHHQAEALFKALARALDTATRLEPRRETSIPSTKGTLST